MSTRFARSAVAIAPVVQRGKYQLQFKNLTHQGVTLYLGIF